MTFPITYYSLEIRVIPSDKSAQEETEGKMYFGCGFWFSTGEHSLRLNWHGTKCSELTQQVKYFHTV